MAVLAVVVYHCRPHWLTGGFSGVDVFFVISGYVVSASLMRDSAERFGAYLLGFYRRRILRIFPALIVCLLATTLATVLLTPDAWLGTSNRDTGLAAFFGWANYALVGSTDGYFSTRTDFNPFLHTWSLAVEEQFYLLFPPLLYLGVLAGKRLGMWARLTSWVIPTLGIASLGWAIGQTPVHPLEAFYLLPARFWELAAGASLMAWQLKDGGGGAFRLGGLLCKLLGRLSSEWASFFVTLPSSRFPGRCCR